MDTLGNNNNTILKEDDKSELMLRDSEDLVRIAIGELIEIGQIRKIYNKAKTRGKVEFEVFLKYQMGRPKAKTDNKILPMVFVNKLLLLYEKYQYQKHDLMTILKYAVMLYRYEQDRLNSSNSGNSSVNNKDYWNNPQQKRSQQPQSYNSISPDIRQKLEKTIENNTKNYGFDKIEIDRPISASFRQGYQARLKIKVHLKRYYGNRRELSDHLKTILQNQIPEISTYEIIIWIEMGLRS